MKKSAIYSMYAPHYALDALHMEESKQTNIFFVIFLIIVGLLMFAAGLWWVSSRSVAEDNTNSRASTTMAVLSREAMKNDVLNYIKEQGATSTLPVTIGTSTHLHTTTLIAHTDGTPREGMKVASDTVIAVDDKSIYSSQGEELAMSTSTASTSVVVVTPAPKDEPVATTSEPRTVQTGSNIGVFSPVAPSQETVSLIASCVADNLGADIDIRLQTGDLSEAEVSTVIESCVLQNDAGIENVAVPSTSSSTQASLWGKIRYLLATPEQAVSRLLGL